MQLYRVPMCANWINDWRLQLEKCVIHTTANQLHWLNIEPNRIHRFRMHTWQVAVSEGPFLQRTSCSDRNVTATNRMHPRILNWNIAVVAVLIDFTNMAVMLSGLLRNLTFNSSAHGTQVSDQCPLGLLLNFLFAGFCQRVESDLLLFLIIKVTCEEHLSWGVIMQLASGT